MDLVKDSISVKSYANVIVASPRIIICRYRQVLTVMQNSLAFDLSNCAIRQVKVHDKIPGLRLHRNLNNLGLLWV